MNYTQVSSPSWDKSGTKINCMVVFESLGEVPFTADQNDYNPWCQEIYHRCVAGEFGPVADYVFELDEGPNPQSTGPIPERLLIPVTNIDAVL